jgi:hypothetical protein
MSAIKSKPKRRGRPSLPAAQRRCLLFVVRVNTTEAETIQEALALLGNVTFCDFARRVLLTEANGICLTAPFRKGAVQ